MRWPLAGRRERLRRQASDWIAKLNGPHDARDRAAFERWYRAHADHAEAFDRLAALFEVAQDIRPTVAAAPGAQDGGIRPVRYALAAAAAAGVIVLAFAIAGARQAAPSRQAGVQVAVFTVTGTQSRRIPLRDGSEVVLAPGSALAVAIGGKERRLRLTAGEGHFTVSRDIRPFIVDAQGTDVVARGTQFIVRLDEKGTLVSLIEGRVEVFYPAARGGAERKAASLGAGQRLVVPPRRGPQPDSAILPGARPRAMMIAFDDARLGEAAETMNARAAGRIRLADPALAERRITGAFRIGDAEGFAQGVAAALDLEVARGPGESLWLRAGSGDAAAN